MQEPDSEEEDDDDDFQGEVFPTINQTIRQARRGSPRNAAAAGGRVTFDRVFSDAMAVRLEGFFKG